MHHEHRGLCLRGSVGRSLKKGVVMDGQGASRRTILRSGVLAIGALAGAVGLVGMGERMRNAPLAAPDPKSLITFVLHGTDWHLNAPGLRRGELPKRGDLVSVSGSLTLEGAPAESGTFIAAVQHLDTPGSHGPYSAAQLETHTFRLSDGTLVGVGTSSPTGESVFAIVGGTGRYLGVTGSYVAVQSPLETGGDGTAQFKFTIHSGR
jgi:hypothetical protein